jgi:ABC-type branched-subunit amino acid transport system substrate-binding protein
VALVATAGLLMGACASDDDGGEAQTGGTEEDGGGELGTGVTEDSIKLGYTHIDIAALNEVGIELHHGPYGEIMTALVDDLNANGGINGRTIDLVISPYSPIGTEEGLAVCAEMTEDEQVFAVLGSLQGDQNLCVVEQHSTVLVGGVQTAEFLERARAPWATPDAAAEHSVQALVTALDASGELDGRTIGVYGLASEQVAIDAAKQALADAGADVAFEGINDAPPGDIAAGDAQNATLAQRFRDEGVDALVVAGQAVPAAVFDQEGYHPRLWISNAGPASAAAGGAGVYLTFPDVFTVGGPDQQMQYDSEPFERCKDIWEQASGETVLSPDEAEQQETKTSFIALSSACTVLLIFQEAAEAAGDTLNQSTFKEGLESLEEIELPGAMGSFGPGKYDAPDEYWAYKYNPDYPGPGQGIQAMVLRSDESFELESS